MKNIIKHHEMWLIALIVLASNWASANPNGAISVNGSPPVEEVVFFSFDDHAIPWRDNVFLTPVRAEKHPDNPVLRRGPEGAPDHGHAILYGTVMHREGKFRMWYLGMFETDLKAGQVPGLVAADVLRGKRRRCDLDETGAWSG